MASNSGEDEEQEKDAWAHARGTVLFVRAAPRAHLTEVYPCSRPGLGGSDEPGFTEYSTEQMDCTII